ncbi:MAG: TauD/TfdA family dioxygenase [Rhodospirillaceae bacterium]|jgi:hypothetical protein
MRQKMNAGKREPSSVGKVVVDPAAWSASDLENDKSWVHPLNEGEIAELDNVVKRIEKDNVRLLDITPEMCVIPQLSDRLKQIKSDIIEGKGLALIRGVPVAAYSRLQSAIAFWIIGMHVGQPVSQNAKGHLLGHVADLGGTTLKNPTNRGYQTKETLPYHCDSCDVVGLLCLHPAKSGGESLVTSSLNIYNQMLATAPDLAEELAKPLFRDRRNEIPEGKEPWFILPVFNFRDGFLSVSWQGGYIRSAQRFEELPRHSEKLKQAIELFTKLANELAYAMDFRHGDIQFLHNHVTVHSRTEFEDFPEIDRRRNLLRFWLSTPGGRPLTEAYFDRYGHLGANDRPSGGVIVPGTKFSTPLYPE